MQTTMPGTLIPPFFSYHDPQTNWGVSTKEDPTVVEKPTDDRKRYEFPVKAGQTVVLGTFDKNGVLHLNQSVVSVGVDSFNHPVNRNKDGSWDACYMSVV